MIKKWPEITIKAENLKSADICEHFEIRCKFEDLNFSKNQTKLLVVDFCGKNYPLTITLECSANFEKKTQHSL